MFRLREFGKNTLLIVLALLALALLQLAITFAGSDSVVPGRLADGDCYMWLMRARHLYESGQWFNATVAETNAPYGELLHWSRPFDVLLVTGAALGAHLVGFDTALWRWGLVVAPTLLLFAVPFWWWGTRRLLTPIEFLLSILLIPLLWRVGHAFALARPDHHALLALLFILEVCCLLRLALDDRRPAVAGMAGAVAGLSLWTSVEALVLLLFAVSSLVLFWVIGWHARLTALLRFLAAAAGVVLLGVLLQYPPAEWGAERYTQIAIPHLFLMLCLVVTWAALAWPATRCRNLSGKLALTALAGVAVLLAMWLVFPTFFAGPWIDYDVAMIQAWLPTIEEFGPVFSGGMRGAGRAVMELGPICLAIAGCALMLRDAGQRRAALLLAWGMAIFLPLGLGAVRWLGYAQLLALLPWTLLVSHLWRRAGVLAGAPARIAARLGVVFVLVAGPVLLGASVSAVAPREEARAASFDWAGVARALRGKVPPGAIVMSHTFVGPELAWWGGVRAVASPYGHANIAETWRFFRAADDRESKEVAAARQIDYVLICPADPESRNLGLNRPGSLFDRLARGVPPPWLEPIPLGGEWQEFRLYRANR